MVDLRLGEVPDPSRATSVSEFVELLGRLRVCAGNPSLRTLAKRVGPLLRPPQVVAHTTIANTFQADRRRVSLDLVVAIVRALGMDEPVVAQWRAACIAVHAQAKSGTAGRSQPARDADPGGAAPSRTATRLNQLPLATRAFTGREHELAWLLDLADSPDPDSAPGAVVISAIDGMGGVGKTALALHAAHALAERFPDGQLFIDLQGVHERTPREPGDVLAEFLQAFGTPPGGIPTETAARAAAFRDRLAGTRTLLVLDNAASEEQIRPLLPGTGGCLVLITSRLRLKGLDDAYPLNLDVLPTADAVALFRSIATAGRVPAGDPLLEETVTLCGRLPLALRIAAALLRSRPTWTLQHLIARLSASRASLTGFSDGERDLASVFDLSYRALRDDHQIMFRYLGLIPGPDADAYAAAALLDIDVNMADLVLQDLVDHNLLAEIAPGRYSLHDLLRRHAGTLAETVDPAIQRETALDRLLHYYAHTAQTASRTIARLPRPAADTPAPVHAPDLTDPATARAWLRTEHPNLDAAHTYAHHLDHHHTIALAAGMAEILLSDGPWIRALEIHQAAAEAGARHDRFGAHATALTDLGRVMRLTGDLPGATDALARALEFSRRIGHHLGEANALTNLGQVQFQSGDFPGAGDAFARALQLYRQIDDRLGEANALNNIGRVRYAIGDFRRAADAHTRALEIFRQIGDDLGQANALNDLGRLRRLTGDFPGAADAHGQALEIFRRIGNNLGEANALNDLGRVWHLTEDFPGAADAHTRALRIFRQIGNNLGEAMALNDLGRVRYLTGDFLGAADAHEWALKIFRQIGDRGNEAWALNLYAATVAALGDRPGALALYRQALVMNQELNKPDDEAISLEGIADHHLASGDPAEASAYLNQAVEIYQRLGMIKDIERVQARLSEPATQ